MGAFLEISHVTIIIDGAALKEVCLRVRAVARTSCVYTVVCGLIISGSSSRDDSNGSLVVTLSLWIRIWIWNVTLGLQIRMVRVDLV